MGAENKNSESRYDENMKDKDDHAVNAQADAEQRWYIQARSAVYYIMWIVEVILGFRLVLMLFGANPKSSFVNFIYLLSRLFIAPFTGVFNILSSKSDSSQLVFEPSTVVAMIVYAIIAKGVVNLIRLRVVGSERR